MELSPEAIKDIPDMTIKAITMLFLSPEDRMDLILPMISLSREDIRSEAAIAGHSRLANTQFILYVDVLIRTLYSLERSALKIPVFLTLPEDVCPALPLTLAAAA